MSKKSKNVQRKQKFSTLVLIFLVGALSFAVALSYNNFAQAIISKYSVGGDGVVATFINLAIFTVIALGFLYALWRVNPHLVTSAVA